MFQKKQECLRSEWNGRLTSELKVCCCWWSTNDSCASDGRTNMTHSQVTPNSNKSKLYSEDNKGARKCRLTFLRRLNCLSWQTDFQNSPLLHTAYIPYLQTTGCRCVCTHTQLIHMYRFYRRSFEHLLLWIWGKLCISCACEQLLQTSWISKTRVCTERGACPSINTLAHLHDGQMHIYM